MSHCGNCTHGCCCYCTRENCGLCRRNHDGGYKKCAYTYYKSHYICLTCRRGWKRGEVKQPGSEESKFWEYTPSRCSICKQNGIEVSKVIAIPASHKTGQWQILTSIFEFVETVEFKRAKANTIANAITAQGFHKFLDAQVHRTKGNNFWLPKKKYELLPWKTYMLTKPLNS